MSKKSKTYAVTINNVDVVKRLKSMDKVKDYLALYSDVVYLISVERNEFNNNTHYHILLDGSYLDGLPIKTDFWYKEIQSDFEILKYIDYIKKGGQYKVYNLHEAELSSPHWTTEVMQLVLKYDKISDLLKDNPKMLRHIHYIEKAFSYLKNPFYQ